MVIDGDAHINNFGLYGTAQRDVVIDLNDFDEAITGSLGMGLKAAGGKRQCCGAGKRLKQTRTPPRSKGMRCRLPL